MKKHTIKEYEDSLQDDECEQTISTNRETSLLIEQTRNKSLWKSTNLRQKFLLVDLIFIEFVVSGCGAVSYAFFARVVVERGGTVFESALILQTANACATIGSFVFGMYQQKIGYRRLLYGGLVLTGVSQIAFGCLDFIDNIRIFTASGVILKGLCGFGIAGSAVASFTAIADEYPEHISQVVGFYYTATGSARFVGPAFGGYLYKWIGMFPPIAIWGAIPIVTLPIHYFTFKKESSFKSNKDTEQIDMKSFFLNVSTIAILALLFTVCGIFAYTDVVLTVYFQSLGLSVTMAGLGGLCIGGTLAISGPIVGYLAGKRQWIAPVFLIGGSMAISGVLLIFSPGQLTSLVYIGCALLGVFGSVVLVPTFETLLLSYTGGAVDVELNLPLYSKISGIWEGAACAGLTLIPIIFSAIQTATESSVSVVLYSLSGLLFLFAVFFLIVKICEKRYLGISKSSV